MKKKAIIIAVAVLVAVGGTYASVQLATDTPKDTAKVTDTKKSTEKKSTDDKKSTEKVNFNIADKKSELPKSKKVEKTEEQTATTQTATTQTAGQTTAGQSYNQSYSGQSYSGQSQSTGNSGQSTSKPATSKPATTATTATSKPATTQSKPATHTHNWVPHWDYCTNYKTVQYTQCHVCGADISYTDENAHMKKHALEGNGGSYGTATRNVPYTDYGILYYYCSSCGAKDY